MGRKCHTRQHKYALRVKLNKQKEQEKHENVLKNKKFISVKLDEMCRDLHSIMFDGKEIDSTFDDKLCKFKELFNIARNYPNVWKRWQELDEDYQTRSNEVISGKSIINPQNCSDDCICKSHISLKEAIRGSINENICSDNFLRHVFKITKHFAQVLINEHNNESAQIFLELIKNTCNTDYSIDFERLSTQDPPQNTIINGCVMGYQILMKNNKILPISVHELMILGSKKLFIK